MIPNAHITIWNKYIDPTTRSEKYQRAVIYNCVWQSTKAVSRMREMTAANIALVLVPFASDTGYQEPKAWQIDRDGWTFQEGDVVARGMINQDLDTEYTVTDLRAEHENIVTIASVDAMDEGSPNVQHWELNCK